MHYVLSTMVVNNGCDKNIATLLPMTNILECYSIRVHLWIFRNRKVDGNKYIRNHEQANHELKRGPPNLDNVYHGGDNRCLVLEVEVEVEAELREAPQLKVVEG